MRIIDTRMADGSRHFCSLPEGIDWWALRDRLRARRGVSVTDFVTDGVTEAWIDFVYAGHRFSVSNQFGEYWAFSEAGDLSEALLEEVAGLLRELVGAAPRA